jgi:probable HAF family extracellular repeat protein
MGRIHFIISGLIVLQWACTSQSPTEPEAKGEPVQTTTLTAAASYQVVGLGSLGGTVGEAFDMNLAGQIVGQSETKDGRFHAFIWETGIMRDLGTLPNQTGSSTATDINSKGQVVGFSDVGIQEHAVLWQNGTIQDLGTFGGSNSRALDIDQPASSWDLLRPAREKNALSAGSTGPYIVSAPSEDKTAPPSGSMAAGRSSAGARIGLGSTARSSGRTV